MRIGFVPIDNRPVCYTLPKLVAEIDESLELCLPERGMLGSLAKYADADGIIDWLENLADVDAYVISLDTIAYGGLISSRRCSSSFSQILARIERLKNVLIGKKVYAFSSIMRISNNNINEEEKSYWDKWGEKIFKYSYEYHRSGESPTETDVPPEILADYLNTRARNFEINKVYLDWQKDGIFETLIFSKDDCAPFGINVLEAEKLKSLGGFVKTGADEIPMSLLARAIGGKYKIAPTFLEAEFKHLISNYEDISIEECVNSQIELVGCEVVDILDADVELIVNNFIHNQGEIVMNVPTKLYDGGFECCGKPFVVADVRNANGADNKFVDELLKKGFDENFLGYSAWNTSANTLGSLLFSLKVVLNSKKNGSFNSVAFKKLMLTRFLDDWAYQANVRQMLNSVDNKLLSDKMSVYAKELQKYFYVDARISYSFPWGRLFEVEIEFI